eukprot:GFUD01039703.1.p1 GENE.GFUD01039703.1~~GFUD01039703.1.p1  ORF type:complete len:381 (-),score=97.13 GFUD01039703.1:62-1204(-)
MADSNFRKNVIRIFSKVVSEDIIVRRFKQNACHLCKVQFHDEKSAWKHYYGSLHGDRMKSLPKMEKAPEFWVMILKSLEVFDPKLISKNDLIDYLVDKYDVREKFSMACITDKVDSNMGEMINYFQTVKKTGNLFGLKQRGRQELQKVSGKRFLEHENRKQENRGFDRDERSSNDRRRSEEEKSQNQEYKRRREDESNSSRVCKQERRSSSIEPSRKVQDRRSSDEEPRKTPSPSSPQNPTKASPTIQREAHQLKYLQTPQQQHLQAPQQAVPTRPIIILPPNLNLSSLPPNLFSSLGPALAQMLTPQQLQSHPMMFPYSQFSNPQVQQPQPFQPIIPPNSTPQTPSPPQATTKPVSPRTHYKKFVQQQQQAEEPCSARV